MELYQYRESAKNWWLFVVTSLVLLFTGGRLAFADDLGFVLGLRSDSATPSGSGYNVQSLNSVSFGGWGRFVLNDTWAIRSGMHFIPRAYRIEIGNASDNLKFTYFEIPVGIMYRLSEVGGIFAGPSFGFQLDKDCGTVCSGVNANYIALQLGGSFKIAPQLGVELFFEQGSQKIISVFESQRAVGVNVFVTIE